MRSPQLTAGRVLPLCALLACQGEPTTPTAIAPGPMAAAVTDNVVAAVTVVPDSQMVFFKDTFQVTAQPKNAAGEALQRAITWKVSNTNIVRTIDATTRSTMGFRTLKVGKTTIRATTDGKSATSIVVVRGTASAKVVVTPAEVSVGVGATVQFAATGRTKNDETTAVNVTWTSDGGAVSATGVLAVGTTPGTIRVIARSRFGAADTAVVTVGGASEDKVSAVVLVPASASVAVGGTLDFDVYALDTTGDSVATTASFTATGGTISGDGRYVAGSTAGTFSVIATGPDGLADTSEVTVLPPGVGRVVLGPSVLASRGGAVTRFAAAAWSSTGDSLPDTPAYEATCGTITGSGSYTAPLGQSGSCLVTAAVGDRADTTEVILLPQLEGRPFGLFGLWNTATTTPAANIAPFRSSHDYVAPAELLSQIAAARAKGVRLVLALTGGSHDRYKTNGVFDRAKWNNAMNAYNTPAIQEAVAAAVADGTIIGNSVMDEPQQSGTSAKSWGPAGTMTKVRVDSLCGYVKGIFPTLPVGVFHDANVFEPASSYTVCEFLITQYAHRKGNVTTWRDNALSIIRRDDMSVIFSLNVLDGGVQDKSGAYDCAGTGGLGTNQPNCRMTPQQVRDFGQALGPAGCALFAWRHDGTFMGKPENQAAISELAIMLAGLEPLECRRL